MLLFFGVPELTSLHLLFLSFFFFNWSIVDLQCCSNLCCTEKWLRFTHIHILFLIFFSIMVYPRSSLHLLFGDVDFVIFEYISHGKIPMWSFLVIHFIKKTQNFFFNWSIVGLQCRVSFRCTAKWFSYTYILFFRFFSIIGYYKILNIVPSAI